MKESRIKRIEETVEKIKIRDYPLTMNILRTAMKKRLDEKLTAREKRIIKGASSLKIDLVKLKYNIENLPKEKTVDEKLKDEISTLKKERDVLLTVKSISTKA